MSQKTVLIVDDEDLIREAMKDILDSKGYKVFEADNGIEGLKLIFEHKIDLIVLDLNMPRMDGYMFMEHLNKKIETEKRQGMMPKILVLTAVDFKKDLGLAQNLGASRFMNKPFQSVDFLANVSSLLEE